MPPGGLRRSPFGQPAGPDDIAMGGTIPGFANIVLVSSLFRQPPRAPRPADASANTAITSPPPAGTGDQPRRPPGTTGSPADGSRASSDAPGQMPARVMPTTRRGWFADKLRKHPNRLYAKQSRPNTLRDIACRGPKYVAVPAIPTIGVDNAVGRFCWSGRRRDMTMEVIS